MTDASSTAREDRLPPHRLPLPGSERLTVWRWVQVRGTGFPARWLLSLAAPEAVEASRRVHAALESTREARARAVQACLEELSRPEAGGRADVVRALTKLRAGRVPRAPLPHPVLERDVHALVQAHDLAARRRVELVGVMTASAARVSLFLREIARDPLFREAVTWQNRSAVHNALDSLLRHEPGRTNNKTRENERLVAKYLQRYCARNERIGFFGPLGWGRIDPSSSEPIAVRVGPRLLATRKVFFEFWTIDALAETLSLDSELRPWIAPRLVSTAWLDGDVLVEPSGARTALAAGDAKVLGLCDGRRSAREVAGAALGGLEVAFADETQVFGVLDEMVRRGWLRWTLEVPACRANPDQALARLLDAVPEPAPRARGLAVLEELDSARRRVAAAAGDASALDRALGDLEETFVRSTARAPRRRAGESYAGRTLVFEDCRRDLDLRLGPEFFARVGPPVALLSTSVRWYTFTLAERYRALFLELHRTMARELGTAEIDFLVFRERAWQHLPQMLQWSKAAVPVIDAVSSELRSRWAALLGLSPDARHVERSVEVLARGVAEAFPAPHPGWPLARFSSPDIVVSSIGDEGGPHTQKLVLGELHMALNTLVAAGVNMDDVPPAAELVRAWEADLAPSPFLLHPKEMLSTRISHESTSPLDYDIEMGDASSWRDPAHRVPVGSLVVVEAGGRPLVRQRRSGLTFDLIAFLQYPLTTQADVHFGVVPRWKHTPRVTIGGLVVNRETWRFAVAECPFVTSSDAADRFLGARAWVLTHGLPRFCFVKVPGEKPWYVDFESPIYVDLLASLVRRHGELTVSEMTPSVEDAWLPGPEGQRFLCELRMVVVDDEPWRAPPAA